MARRSAIDRASKRVFDVLVALTGGLLSVPIFLVVAFAIKFDSPGPVFFRQVRIGRGGGPFTLWKFRTMVEDAPLRGPGVTAEGDTRITRVGEFLRRTKLDELPQLLNVVAGSMSLVGPRPEIPQYVELYTREERQVLEWRPGITDPASITFRHEETILGEADGPERYYTEVVMRTKLAINLEYATSASVRTDLWVIWKTLLAVVWG